MKNLAIALTAAAALTVTACGSDEPDGPPVIHGKDGTVVAQVDCAESGVAGVHVVYGEINDRRTIGRNPVTLTLADGEKTFDERYGISDGYKDLPFTITTTPTTGTCTTTLTDDETGDVVAEKKSAGKVELKVIMAGDSDS